MSENMISQSLSALRNARSIISKFEGMGKRFRPGTEKALTSAYINSVGREEIIKLLKKQEMPSGIKTPWGVTVTI